MFYNLFAAFDEHNCDVVLAIIKELMGLKNQGADVMYYIHNSEFYLHRLMGFFSLYCIVTTSFYLSKKVGVKNFEKTGKSKKKKTKKRSSKNFEILRWDRVIKST